MKAEEILTRHWFDRLKELVRMDDAMLRDEHEQYPDHTEDDVRQEYTVLVVI